MRFGLERLPRPVGFLIAVAMDAVIGVVDYFPGYQVSLTVLYVLPMVFAAWYVGAAATITVALLSVGVAFAGDLAGGKTYPSAAHLAVDLASRVLINVAIALLLSGLQRSHARERDLARTDALTGAIASRHFRALLQAEIDRSRRYGRQFSLAYLDIDGFKHINDTGGHASGDNVLRAVAVTMRGLMRAPDVLGRLGGDEFAILLPETGADAARVPLAKLRDAVRSQVDETGETVTLSVGLVTFATPPSDADEALRLSDRLMYEAKADGKDRVRSVVYDG